MKDKRSREEIEEAVITRARSNALIASFSKVFFEEMDRKIEAHYQEEADFYRKSYAWDDLYE